MVVSEGGLDTPFRPRLVSVSCIHTQLKSPMKAKKQDKRSPNVPVTDTRRRNLRILGGGAALAAGLGAVGYKAGWFSEAPAPTPTPAPTPVPARLSLGPKLTPVTLDPPNYANALRSANEMMEYYARSIDNPYCLIHAIRAFGKNFVRKDGSNAVNYLCTTHAADMQVNGKYYVYFELINEVHQNSFLKTFLEAGVSRDQKLTVQGRQYTVNNLAESAKALFRFDPNNLARFDPKYAQEHLPWGIIAFSILMTPDSCSWTNAHGETIDLNQVVDKGLADYEAVMARGLPQIMQNESEPDVFIKDIRSYACYGLHSMYAFVSAVNHGYRANNLEERVKKQVDVLTYRLKADADALINTYDTEGKGAPPIAVEGLKLRSLVQMLGHAFESLNYVRLHKLMTFSPAQERRIDAGQQKFYEYLVRWRAMDIGALETTVDSMIGKGHGVKFMSDLVIALGHADRALKLTGPQNPDLA